MNQRINPKDAAERLGELLQKNPSKATEYVNAIMGNKLVPYQTKQYLEELIDQFRWVEHDGGVAMPFGPRLTFEDVVVCHDLDHDSAKQVVQKLYDDDLTVDLQRRIGTDADRAPSTEVTRRDAVEAAFDLHASQPSQE